LKILRLLPFFLLALALASGALRAATEVPEPPAPVIPAATFDITAYGAIGDGHTLCTGAFEHAIDACQQAGGGSVIVPPGNFLTGPFHLVSHMALVIEKGAVIQSTGKPADSGLPDPLPTTQEALNALRPSLKVLISGRKLTDVAIRGEGIIDGAGAWWWAHSDRAARDHGGVFVPRPNLIVIQNCQRLQVQGVTLRNSPQFHLVPKSCTDVLIDGVKILAPPDSPNTDAIDPSNCRNVLIRHVLTDNGDDNVALKAGGDGPCENITVTDCTFLHGHGVSIGSETNGGVRNFLVQRCTFENTGTAIRIKSSRGRGGIVQDVTYRDITMKNVDQAIYINLFYEDKADAKYPQPKPMTPLTPQVRDILISNVQCVNAKAAGEITGLPESPATVTLENIHVTAWTGFALQDVQGLTFRNVSFLTSPKPPELSPSPSPAPAVATAVKPAGTPWPTSFPVPLPPALKAKVLTGSLTVAADGSGDLPSIQDAVYAAPDEPQGGRPFVIHIKPGIYREIVTVPPQKGAITFEGEDAATTIITGSNTALTPDVNGRPMGTFKTATVFVQDDDFSASNITFQNSAGNHGQALAINVGGDRAVFRKCQFLGWQDTILLLQRRQYFEDCRITGVVDFIFGAATAYFQRCDIHCLANGYITAASTPKDQPYGFVFDHCTITAEPNVKTYLGRPWRPFASVTFLNTLLTLAIAPEGWHSWNNADTEHTARYAEYNSIGPGASPATRVPWSRQLTTDEAAQMTPATVLGGWSPAVNPAPQ
jgi:pectin methylesterase-like acyl-CoA thioesterase